MSTTMHRLSCLITILAVSTAKDLGRWSRQISSYTSDMSDWVPLPGPVEKPADLPPIKRQAVAEPRILSEPYSPFPTSSFRQDPFQSRVNFQSPSNRQLYLHSVPSVPSAPQNFLTDQGFNQGFRFGLSQPNYNLNQGFIASQMGFENFPQVNQVRQPALPLNPVKFESLPKILPGSPQAKPFGNQAPKKPAIVGQQKFVNGYPLENSNNSFTFPQNSQKKKPQSLQKLKYEVYDKPRTPEQQQQIPNNKQKSEREEVQLLYVPVESLNRGQFTYKNQLNFNSDPFAQTYQKPPAPQQTFASDFQRPGPLENYNLGQQYFTAQNAFLGQELAQKPLDQEPKYSTISSPFPTAAPTTPRPKKLKPHQPPLAVFFTQEGKNGDKVKVGDVLHTLKNAKTVAVLDSVSPNNAPKVFIGPNTLTPPENYVKFELPYMSNLENSDRKLKQLPFFVAPLSYNTPEGFAKIPFPSPHVGSVIVNAQAKDTTTQYPSTPSADIIPNSYTATSPSYKQEAPVNQKPTFSYFSTVAPKTNSPVTKDYKESYYSFEPQTVSTIRPRDPEPSIITAPPKQENYYNSEEYKQGEYVEYKKPNQKYNERFTTKGNPDQRFTYRPEYVSPAQGSYDRNIPNAVKNSTPRTTTRLSSTKQTTQSPSTYPSQLLETHNPYSINQAFHLSTPIDYQNYYDEYKESKVTPGTNGPQTSLIGVSTTDKVDPIVTEKPKYQTTPNYVQNYSPEIHYESENSKYSQYNTQSNDYSTRPDANSEGTSGNTEYSTNSETKAPEQYESINPETTRPLTDIEQYYQSTKSPSVYNQYLNNGVDYREPAQEISSTTTTTTTTTAPIPKRTPLRTRGRPRYTTVKPDSSETTKAAITRKPLRERRPLPSRSKYEPNKISTEKISRRPGDSSEATTKAVLRGRQRGRVQFKSSEADYDKRLKTDTKEQDLAYQRDVLHQNYPVTIQERVSTVDIEAQTEPLPRISPSNNLDPVTETYLDTEQAYSNEQAFKQPEPNYSINSEYQTEASYVPRSSSTRNDEYVYNSRSSAAPSQSYPETNKDESIEYSKSTERTQEIITEHPNLSTEEPVKYSIDNNYSIKSEEEIATTRSDLEITKIGSSSQSDSQNVDYEPQTTPTYRIRPRLGARIQNHPASSTESSSTTARTTKVDRRRTQQAVTYRPSYDRRRTTMRIDEIEADLKTKPVHSRPEQEYRHPVYKPEPTTVPPVTTPNTEPTKRGQFRRRRPSYTTTSTEASASKKGSYEIKSRFKGRRPTTEKNEKVDSQSEAPSSTSRSVPYSRFARPKLSERYNKKPVENTENHEDQESNYSINRPRYLAPEEQSEADQWSVDSFRPYNPNEIQEDKKVATTERRSDRIDELDIITARNDYEDILVSVTPASNKANKKVPEIPPTLEALVEQSKVASESSDSMSNFESMLEQVMKSLEEQDENEYTTNVMKHKGGEIGEIPPENPTADNSAKDKTTTVVDSEVTTVEPETNDTTSVYEEDTERHGRRRGFWKKVHVRPVTTESIEVAESQYYSNTVNQLGDPIKSKLSQEKRNNNKVTTYKPSFNLKDIFDDEENKDLETLPFEEVSRIISSKPETDGHETTVAQDNESKVKEDVSTEKAATLGEIDLGTGSSDPTIMDLFYTPTSTEASSKATVDKSDGMSIMDYLFGVTSPDSEADDQDYGNKVSERTKVSEVEITTESTKPKLYTTESTFIPDEITAVFNADETTEGSSTEFGEIKKVNATEVIKSDNKELVEVKVKENAVETSSVSSFMDPTNVVSTSMSTEISHETEICFRGKCIKTRKDIL